MAAVDDTRSFLANFRDLGGLPTESGRSTRSGILYRADAPRPDDSDPAGVDWPPALVVDLRSPDELTGTHPLAGRGPGWPRSRCSARRAPAPSPNCAEAAA